MRLNPTEVGTAAAAATAGGLTGALPFVLVLAVGIVVLAVFPDIVIWLPNQIHGG